MPDLETLLADDDSNHQGGFASTDLDSNSTPVNHAFWDDEIPTVSKISHHFISLIPDPRERLED